MITHTFQTNKLSRRNSISTLFAHMHYFVATWQATTTMTKHTLLLVVIELAIVNISCYTFAYYVSIGRQGLLCYSCSCCCSLSSSSSSSLSLSSSKGGNTTFENNNLKNLYITDIFTQVPE
jgi:hypothetical protein